MKNLKFSFYFYAAFIAFALITLISMLFTNDLIGFIVLSQLIWGPISIIHCLILFINHPNTPLKKHINISFIITILYFLLLITVGSLALHIIEAKILSTIYLFVIPWLMLGYFTYIQFRISKEN